MCAQRLRQHAGPAARPRDAALVVERLPEQERRAQRLERRRPRLRRHPHERRAQLFLAEVRLHHVAVRLHDLAERALPVVRMARLNTKRRPSSSGPGAERNASRTMRANGRHRSQNARYASPSPGIRLEVLRRALEVAVDEERVAILERREEERVEVDVLEAVPLEPELLDDGREPDQDVRAAAEIEAVARHDLLRRDGAADDVLPLEDAHAPPACARYAAATSPL
jgi:hypothetical protein